VSLDSLIGSPAERAGEIFSETSSPFEKDWRWGGQLLGLNVPPMF
jgi:hypothetical protein